MHHFIYYLFTSAVVTLFQVLPPVQSFSAFPHFCPIPVKPYAIKDGAVILYSQNNLSGIHLLLFCLLHTRVLNLAQYRSAVNTSLTLFRQEGNVEFCQIQCRQDYEPYTTIPTEYRYLDISCNSIGSIQCRRPYCSLGTAFVTNGNVECTNNNLEDSFCALKCNAGYRAKGTSFKHCVDGTWEPKEEWKCEEIKCVPPPTVRNGVLACNGDKPFSECTLLCDRGHEASGPYIGVCLELGGELGDWRWMGDNSTEATEETTLNCSPQIPQPQNTTVPSNNTDVNELLLLLYISGSTTRPYSEQAATPQPQITAIVPIRNNITVSKKRFDACDVNPSERVKCGPQGSTRLECEGLKCCWEDDGLPRDPLQKARKGKCFERSSYIINQGKKTPPPPQGFIPKITPPLPPLIGSLLPNTIGISPCSRVGSSFTDIRNNQAPVHPLCEACGCRSEIVNRAACNLNLPQNGISERVICGKSAEAIDWPWNVLIYINDRLFCGGTLIAAQYVLTAGHCLPPLDTSFGSSTIGSVLLGITNSSQYTRENQYRRIATFQRHPNFTLGNGAGFIRNDVAIIKLASPVVITSTVRPLCMPNFREPMLGDDECHVSGFGKTTMYGPNKISEILQSAQLPLVRLSTCVQYYRGIATNGENICAGSNKPNTPDTCSGDSGGPLACKKRGEKCWYLAGVTSYGRTPCGQGIPSVYVNVKKYQDWIFETVANMVSYLG